MLNSFALVKNVSSTADELLFSDFRLKQISHGDLDLLRRAQHLFPRSWPLYGDWIYEKNYKDSNAWERIPYDIEDTLFLLRLFKIGDLVFLQPCIENTSGELSVQLPYRVMSYVHTTRNYQIKSEECAEFETFASEIMHQTNWSATWFQTARRFFLYGGGKEYNPRNNEVDRIVDYMTAIEATLVPETDFVGRRLRERAVSLLKDHDIAFDGLKNFIRDLYDIRSSVVHGSNISDKKRDVLKKDDLFESLVRKVIVAAIKTLPEDDTHRKSFLKQLFDVCDQTRVAKVYNDFCSIKAEGERKRCFERITKLFKNGENK